MLRQVHGSHRHSTFARANVWLGVLCLSLALAGCGRSNHQSRSDHVIKLDVALNPHSAPEGLPTLAPMVARTSAAVVNISVQGTKTVTNSPILQNPLFRQFFNLPNTPVQQRFLAVGSGVIVDADKGYVITNSHVVKNAQVIQVTLKDRRQFTARLVGSDPQTDVAVLRIPTGNLSALPLGRSADVKVGDYVVAIGDPFAVGQAATFGIVSALGRSGLGIESYEDFIQTDAPINPGNSGGALLNMAGQLIGMNTAILTGGGGSSVGIGFAIPVDMVRRVAQQLIATGKVSRGELGITVQDLTPNLARALGLKALSGALVAQVIPGSPAERAGIRTGDVITAVNGTSVATSSDLRNAVGEKPPGTSVALNVLRNGNDETVHATLEPLRVAQAQAPSVTRPETGPLAGVAVGAVPQNDPEYGKLNGVYVQTVAPDSEAAMDGLQQGDIIVSVDRGNVRTPDQLSAVVRAHRPGAPLLLEVERQGNLLFLAIGG